MCHLNKVNPVMSNKDTVDTEFCTCPGTANTTQDTTLILWDLRILVSFLKQSREILVAIVVVYFI